MEYRILAIVIVYKPDLPLLKRNITAFKNDVDCLIIWNNSPEFCDEKTFEFESVKILYHTEGHNVGISKALNYAWIYARKNKYDYLLTMDQDSVWVNFKGFLNKVFSFENPNNIFGPEYDFREEVKFREYEYRITSGMFLSIDILNAIGGYCKNFMVDGVDVELCYRAREHGYRVYNISGSTIEHHAGSHLICNFLGYRFISDGYSPFRIYGIICNHLMIFKRYKVGWRAFYYIIKHYYIMMPIKILLGENDKKKKLTAYIKGICDGIKKTIE